MFYKYIILTGNFTNRKLITGIFLVADIIYLNWKNYPRMFFKFYKIFQVKKEGEGPALWLVG